ncbi:MAG: ABC transporter ATP-binding protein [Oscillospiraceae bacterium]|nr:ABC transporter ATP-binding protein [Oscillospiraceae bacterium]
MNAIQTQKLCKYYGKARGILDVDLTVAEGDFFGFIGPNGAGKSTTIRSLLGLIRPTSGSARIFGKEIGKEYLSILKDIGYLPSETAFYPGMRVEELLRFSARLHKTDCTQEARLLCDRLELDPKRKIRELSLGNRKKLGIVCALQHKPRLYILDEPTSGLDPLMQKEFYEILRQRNAEGATIFLSSHVLSEIARYCNKAAVISEGRILAADSVENLGHTGVKKVTLRGCPSLPKLQGAKDQVIEGDSLRFLYSGDPRRLLQELSSLPFEDISITDPDLEEIFLHYYTKEEG